jgi:hypothetical protein
MPKSTGGYNPSEYATVAQRIALFRAAYPFGRIRSRLHSRDDGQITFEAEVFRRAEDTEPAATGWASERVGDGEINISWCLENTETSAIGRALANLGFTASRQRASLEEMLAATRRSARPSLTLVHERMPQRVHERVHEAHPPEPPPAPREKDLLQETADALADVLGQLTQAERLGMPAREVARLRRALGGRLVAPSAIARAERELHGWFEAHMPLPRFDGSGTSRHDEPPRSPSGA